MAKQKQIFIKHDALRTKALNVGVDCSIQQLKSTVQSTFGVPIDEQRLTTSTGKPLTNDTLSISDYGIQNETTLILNGTRYEAVTITVDSFIGAATKVVIHPYKPVKELKEQIFRLFHVLPTYQKISFEQKELDDDATPLYVYGIKKDCKVSIEFNKETKSAKIPQEMMTQIQAEANIVEATYASLTEYANAVLADSRNKVNQVSNLADLAALDESLWSAMEASCGKIHDVPEMGELRRNVINARQQMSDHYKQQTAKWQQQMWCFDDSISHCDRECAKCNGEISEMQRKIKSLERKRDELSELKRATQSFRDKTFVRQKKKMQTAYRQKEIELQTVQENADSAFGQQVEKMNDFQDELEEIIAKKQASLERNYAAWSTDDVLQWIAFLENGYFKDAKFAGFMATLKEMEIGGAQIPEINSTLFLRMAGLKNKREQDLLRQHLNRIVRDHNDAQYRNICGVCAVNAINTVILPCGHQYYCQECANRARSQSSRCPMCRKNGIRVIQTYLSGFSKLKQ